MNFDFYLFQQINNLAGHWPMLDSLGVFFAVYFQYVLSVFLLVFLFLGKDSAEKNKNRLMVGLVFLSAGVARLGFTEILYQIFHRLRPFVAHQIHQLVAHDAANSFPSGHAAFFFAMAMVVYLFNKKLGYLFFAGAFLISVARIYVGVHYPLDILGGVAVGILTGWGTIKIFNKIFQKEISKTP